MQNQNQPTTGARRRLIPSAKLAPGHLWRLSFSDREYLSLIVANPVEYVHDARFARHGLRRFGRCVPSSETIFACFNYARFRVYRIFLKNSDGIITLSDIRSLLFWSRRADSLRDSIVRENTGLVIHMMRNSGNLGQPDEDEMRSDGTLALANSVNGFDPNRLTDKGKPIKFSTYSCRAILQAFARAGGRSNRRKKLFPTSYDPTMEQSDGDETRRQEAVSESAAEVLRIVRENRANLSDTETLIIQERFFSDARNGKGMTLGEIGKIIGVSKERVRQLEVKAKQKIREALEPSLR